MMLFLTRVFFFFLPFQLVFSFGNNDLPVFRLVAIGLLFWWLTAGLLTKEKILPPLLLASLLFGWLGIILLSVLFAADPWLSIRKLIFLFTIFPLTLVWYTVMKTPAARDQVIRAALWGGSTAALLGFGIFAAQFFLGATTVFHFLVSSVLPITAGERLSHLVATYPSLLVNIGGATWLRLSALFPDPHGAAYFFGILGCLAFGMYLSSRSKKFLLMGFVLVFADFLTFSRGGYLGLVAAGGILILMFWQQKQWPIRWLLILIGMLPPLLFLGLPVLERFLSTFLLADASSVDRLALWRQAFETWLLYPWFGLGIGQYAEWLYPGIGQSIPYYAHNLYLDLAVETGFLGLSFFLFFCGASIVQSWKNIQRNELFFWGVLAGWALYFTHSVFETAIFSLPVAILCTLLLALPFAAKQVKHPVQ